MVFGALAGCGQKGPLYLPAAAAQASAAASSAPAGAPVVPGAPRPTR
ncbi:MAG: lipoprotein [Betaproteobacteria bacterium]|nr:lipoprotein [Betaproteobacteria bacterium]MCC6249994.1 lipoprotein [Rubrivivax sp.]MCL4697798.1 lipoprotein [Burkholderiaceae bacterium]